ncbi:hypothetical protein SLS57_006963 [Botryosphaeria dothidea]
MAEPSDGEGARELNCHLAPEKFVQAAVSLYPAGLSLPELSGLMSANRDAQSLNLTRQSTVGFMDRFLDEAYTLLLIHLDHEDLKQQYEAVMDDHASGMTTRSNTEHPLREFNVYMSLAIGAALSPNSARLESFATFLHAACMDIFPSLIKNGDALVYIQCILYLVIHSTLSPHGGSTWYLLGLAVSKCISSGFHKDLDVNAGLPAANLESRRRTFWSLYLIDRSISSVMDRPFGIQDHDISVQDLPEGSSDKDSLIHHLIMHAKLTSHSRRDSEGPPMCDYHNFLYWQQLPSPVRKLAAKNQAVSYLLHRLSFRTSAQFIRPLSAEETTMAETVRKLEADVITHCRVFIDELHSQLDVEKFSGSLFDIFDIFAAGILVLYFGETQLTEERYLLSWIALSTRILMIKPLTFLTPYLLDYI